MRFLPFLGFAGAFCHAMRDSQLSLTSLQNAFYISLGFFLGLEGDISSETVRRQLQQENNFSLKSGLSPD